MTMKNFVTVPLRCPRCGQQTHKTLESIQQNGGLACTCGAFTAINAADFGAEIEKSAAAVKDYGVDS